jgi:hypothetical protein
VVADAVIKATVAKKEADDETDLNCIFQGGFAVVVAEGC